MSIRPSLSTLLLWVLLFSYLFDVISNQYVKVGGGKDVKGHIQQTINGIVIRDYAQLTAREGHWVRGGEYLFSISVYVCTSEVVQS